MSRFKLNAGQRRVLAQAAKADTPEVRLWRRLIPLASVSSFMETGAHPDDESSGLLARLALGEGAHVAYVCAVRGEGGQNELGGETGSALGVLRTAELRAAARILGIDLYWLNTELDGLVRDFRFSKSPEETLARWGAERLSERLVRAIRTHRPDALMPTYLDVPGQHGHHRAITRATIAAFRQAGDPQAFAHHVQEGLQPWQPAKLYLPAWSGAGQSYDDSEPPPPATLSVEIGERNQVFGASYAQIGEWSRVQHLSQGMGVWRKAEKRAVPLHLLECARPEAPAAERSIFDGLPRTLGDLAERTDDKAIARNLRAAQAAIDDVLAAFPQRRKVAASVHAALAALRRVQVALPETPAVADLSHRVAVKLRQLARASTESVGLTVRCAPARAELAQGAATAVSLSVKARLARAVSGLGGALRVGPGLAVKRRAGGFTVTAGSDASLAHPYRFDDTLDAPDPTLHALIRYAVDRVRVEVTVNAEPALAILPPVALEPQPDAFAWNLEAPARPIALTVIQDGSAAGQRMGFGVPPGWGMAMNPQAAAGAGRPALGFSVMPQGDPGPERVALRFTANGAQAARLMSIDYPHIGAQHLITTAEVIVRAMRVRLPQARIGYVDGGADRAWLRLQQIGLNVELLDRAAIARGDLDRFDTIVIGVFAYRTRPELAKGDARLQAWLRRGGNLLTLYHRPWDNWLGRTPYSLEIGQPSLRWRVTDENAAVTHLVPDHPLLNAPNQIGPADWQGWSKERGLYFASSWAPEYQALVAMADPGEEPHKGGLLSAPVGKGRHTHTSLNLHHQLDALVPGAYRLFANLVARPPG